MHATMIQCDRHTFRHYFSYRKNHFTMYTEVEVTVYVVTHMHGKNKFLDLIIATQMHNVAKENFCCFIIQYIPNNPQIFYPRNMQHL